MQNADSLRPHNLPNLLFLDIETVAQHAAVEQVPAEWRALWETKAETLLRNREGETTDSLYARAGIYAEFGKIICISCGVIQGAGAARKMTIKSFFGDDERILLQEFAAMLSQWGAKANRLLCAHNGKEFDFPYLCRRMIIHQIPLPELLQISGKKPWEIPHLDTMELWKFGDYKSYTSLNLLAHALGIPTPKEDIDGSKVGQVYWEEKNLKRIVTYCQKDVLTAAQVFLRIIGEPLLNTGQVEMKERGKEGL